MSTPVFKHDAAYWEQRLEAAVGTRIGTAESRQVFAQAVMSKLESSYLRGSWVENEFSITTHFQEKIWAVRSTINDLGGAISRDHASAREFLLTETELEVVSKRLLDFLLRAEAGLTRDSVEQLRPRPGRKIRGAVEIAARIAAEYDRCFGQPPGTSKQGAINNPFTRICKVVERRLEAAGHGWVTFGNLARSEAIEKYCTGAIRKLLGLGPKDVYVAAGDAKTRLLRLRAAIRDGRNVPGRVNYRIG